MVNVIGRPNQNEGLRDKGYWPVGHADPDNPVVGAATPRSLWYTPAKVRAMRAMGMKDEEIDAEFREWAKRFRGNEDG